MRFEVKWTETVEFLNYGSGTIDRIYKDYLKEFETFEEVLNFIKDKTIEWREYDVFNILFIKDKKQDRLYEFKNALDYNVDKWLKRNNLNYKENSPM